MSDTAAQRAVARHIQAEVNEAAEITLYTVAEGTWQRI